MSTTDVAVGPGEVRVVPRPVGAYGPAIARLDGFVVGRDLQMAAPGAAVPELQAAAVDAVPHHVVQHGVDHLRHVRRREQGVAALARHEVLVVDVPLVALDEVADVPVGAVLHQSAQQRLHPLVVAHRVAAVMYGGEPYLGSSGCYVWCLTLDRIERREVVMVTVVVGALCQRFCASCILRRGRGVLDLEW